MEGEIDNTLIERTGEWEVIGKGANWSIIEDGPFRGFRAGKDPVSGNILAFSCRNSLESSRWSMMTSVASFPHLKELDLYKSRYIRGLDKSICNLSNLETLILVRCESLASLPKDIGNLKILREVR